MILKRDVMATTRLHSSLPWIPNCLSYDVTRLTKLVSPVVSTCTFVFPFSTLPFIPLTFFPPAFVPATLIPHFFQPSHLFLPSSISLKPRLTLGCSKTACDDLGQRGPFCLSAQCCHLHLVKRPVYLDQVSLHLMYLHQVTLAAWASLSCTWCHLGPSSFNHTPAHCSLS